MRGRRSEKRVHDFLRSGADKVGLDAILTKVSWVLSAWLGWGIETNFLQNLAKIIDGTKALTIEER